MALAVLAVAGLGGCARPVPQKPEAPAVHDEMICFVAESAHGGGLVCTESARACAALRQAAIDHGRSSDITAVYECKPAAVAVDVTK